MLTLKKKDTIFFTIILYPDGKKTPLLEQNIEVRSAFFFALTLCPFVLFLCPAMGGSVLATVALPLENGTKLAQPGCPIHFGKV